MENVERRLSNLEAQTSQIEVKLENVLDILNSLIVPKPDATAAVEETSEVSV